MLFNGAPFIYSVSLAQFRPFLARSMLPAVLDGLWTLPSLDLALRVIAENWIICAALIAATCLLRWYYKGFLLKHSRSNPNRPSEHLQTTPSHQALPRFSLGDIFARIRRRRPFLDSSLDSFPSVSSPPVQPMRYTRQARFAKKGLISLPVSSPSPPLTAKQPYEAFLVLDVEATCHQGTDFNFPNEIIEFPVCLMQWKDRSDDQKASQLEVVAEFRSFVKPTWQPILSQFCTDLTGITQEQVDSAPSFPDVLASFEEFMIEHELVDEDTGEHLVRFCWCSDGPFDVRDFVVKQCFISKVSARAHSSFDVSKKDPPHLKYQIPMPHWIQGDVLDVRTSVLDWLHSCELPKYSPSTRGWDGPRRRTLNIPAQLKALGLPSFEGRQHSGIDDSRNIAKIIAELARRGISLHPNTAVHPNRRWQWMGKHGQILDGYWTINNLQTWKRL
ncbi:hypothetical protein D9615_001814 [Tricholomella constricta]|uniref:Exonuclease domain-containing protein n=1 Tax=Tricholomella constricta TaxID=117010 RepID=A0A8H5HNT5_9AGAR|nr:hypothetical protein D9615_001814 [Tricholomella constricta]